MSFTRLTDDLWQAIVTRDRRYDGEFVYGVRTTRVFCRPSCSARNPKRKNVAVFADPESAVAAGFRACRRCHPGTFRSPTEEKVSEARTNLEQVVEEDPDAKPTLAELAESVGWSSAHLHRAFRRVVGLSPREYADAIRMTRAKEALRNGDTVLSATFEGGYATGKALYDRAEDAFGMTPGTYRRGGEGLLIRYAVFDTALGSVIIAATDRGLCLVSLGDDPETLVSDFKNEFPAAETLPDDETLGPWAEPILRVLAGPPDHPSASEVEALLALPTDVRATVFQRRVWMALRNIPVGETRTYAEVADAIGQPGAARAVANACGANKLAIVVPCHRVVGSDGKVKGYRWGSQRKCQLLRREGQISGSANT